MKIEDMNRTQIRAALEIQKLRQLPPVKSRKLKPKVHVVPAPAWKGKRPPVYLTYLIRTNPGCGVVKIGRTAIAADNIPGYLEQRYTESPTKQILLGVTEISEPSLHKRFAHFHSHGEWFKEEGELARWIAETFPPDRHITLPPLRNQTVEREMALRARKRALT